MALKASENPPLIWPEHKVISEIQGNWFVAHTKSRNEKAMAWQLLQNNVPYFLPMSQKVTKKNGRIMRSMVPVFPSYIFICGGDDERLEALKTNRVASIIPVKDQQLLVSELAPIAQVLLTGEPLVPHDFMKVGQKCRVIAGPLMGIEGFVEQTANGNRLVLQVDMLGQAASVEIERDLVEPIDSQPEDKR